MRGFLDRLMTWLSIAVFALALLASLPVLLPQFAARAIRTLIEKHWPDSERARAVGWWLEKVFPVIVILALLVLAGLTATRLRERARRIHEAPSLSKSRDAFHPGGQDCPLRAA